MEYISKRTKVNEYIKNKIDKWQSINYDLFIGNLMTIFGITKKQSEEIVEGFLLSQELSLVNKELVKGD